MNHERAAIFEQEKQLCNHVHHETILRVTRLPQPWNFEEKVKEAICCINISVNTVRQSYMRPNFNKIILCYSTVSKDLSSTNFVIN